MPAEPPGSGTIVPDPGISPGQRVVVDASVVLKLYLEEDGSAAADAVAERSRLVAPDLVVAEVANGLWKAVRFGRLQPEDPIEAVAGLPMLFDALVPAAEIVEPACALAFGLDHPVYDCLYLALAAREGVALLTADRRLYEKAAGLPGGPRIGLLGSGPAGQ